MTSSAIRQSFLDFFKEKQHTIVPSSSLLPDAPNLLFTNAGMNQFVPIFLGQAPCPYSPARAADTQKCIRAGGKHNDLEDVGFDTYHHTFFEMLGNWSFGNYFKKEAIEWAWELVVGRWGFPPSRVYATIYSPGPGDPASLDREAHEHWSEIFIQAKLDPAYHVVHGNKKDNFWMMGDTGPCGPCSELHIDLTPGPRDLDIPRQIAGRNLVNQGDARCIEIWNLVFIQFNANPDGTFTDLPAKHVDTGMGFERVTSMIQGTKGFTDFEHAKISNYETDVFRPLFDELEKITGKKYGSTLPSAPAASELKEINFHLSMGDDQAEYDVRIRHAREALQQGQKVKLQLKFRGVEMGQHDEGMTLIRRIRTELAPLGTAEAEPELVGKSIYLILSSLHKNKANEEQLSNDVAFRVIADHIRTLSFSIADGIQPSNEGRGYVLRRILRRAVRYGRNLGLKEPFLGKLVGVLGTTMGHIFPEVVAKADHIRKTLTQEEESFLRTLERGIELFEMVIKNLVLLNLDPKPEPGRPVRIPENASAGTIFPGYAAFKLSDTYGFPLDLTELMARERGLTVDIAAYERLMEEQKKRGRESQVKKIVKVESQEAEANMDPTRFVGFDQIEALGRIVVLSADKTLIATDRTSFYGEMGGQVGDEGQIQFEGRSWNVVAAIRSTSGRIIHLQLDQPIDATFGNQVTQTVDLPRRERVEAHHSGTHLMNWALRKVLGNTITQKGSYVGPDRLRFDFSHGAAMTPAEIAEVEKLVNEKIAADVPVTWDERPYAQVKGDPSILQFFGDKYGETVRVVSIGDFSKELCGGTHVRNSAKVGYFKILHESAIAAGIRRIEAVSGEALRAHVEELLRKQDELLKVAAAVPSGGSASVAPEPTAARDSGGYHEMSLPELWQHYQARELLLKDLAAQRIQHQKEAMKEQEAAYQKQAKAEAAELILDSPKLSDIPYIVHVVDYEEPEYLPFLADALKAHWAGVGVLASIGEGKVSLLAFVSPDFTKRVQAGKIIQAIAPLVGGKGGGRPELAQGGGTNPAGLPAALEKVEELLRAA